MKLSSGTNSGPELFLAVDRAAARPLRAQLEEGLREAVRSGRLAAGTRLPASRVLAGDLGLSRRLIVDVYTQLLAEGYLVSRAGAGTFVAAAGAAPAPLQPPQPPRAPTIDFFPGNPDLAGFPRRAWLKALRETLRDCPDSDLGYPDPRGAPELRRALAGHLGRVRGVVADPEAIVVCGGVAQAFALLAGVLGPVEIAVEDPSLPVHRSIIASAGASLRPLEVDEAGVRLEGLEAAPSPAAIVVTPAHQSPTGVALSSERRAALLAWAAAGEGLIVEDDYDAEYRYDRAPVGALQGLAPERVAHLGTVSKTLAPALRLGWMVLPARLVAPVVERKLSHDHGNPTIDQLALARMLEDGAYERHLRQARRRYRGRRDALVRAVAEHLPQARVTGIAAGLHAIVRLGHQLDALELTRQALRRGVGVYPLGYGYLQPRPQDDGLVLGYANLAEPAIEEGLRRLAGALSELPGPANEGGAMSR